MIYEHKSYRSFLKEVLAEKTKKNPKYSLRAMAKHLGFASSSLSEVMNGKSGFSLSSARRVAARLGLSTEETEYLCLLVQFDSAEDPEVKNSLLSRMSSTSPKKMAIHDLSVDYFKQISEWYHSAILEMADITKFNLTPLNISKRLGISKLEADVALERLLRLELLEKMEDGKIVRTQEHLLVQSNSTHNQALRTFFRQMMQKASEALETQSPKERVSGYETLPMSMDSMPEAKQIIEKFFTEMIALSRKNKKKTDVYHLALHFFNLTNEKG